MSPQFNMHITQIFAQKYKVASKKLKSELLTEYCAVSNTSRNLASKRIINAVKNIYPVALKVFKVHKKRGPKVKFTKQHSIVINRVWDLYDNICAERLYPNIDIALDALIKAGKLTDIGYVVIQKCRQISLGKLKKVLATFPKPKGYVKGIKRPNVYSFIPIEANFNKNASEPGNVGVDPVEHNGGNSAGIYAVTGCYVCICFQWGARHAQLGQNLKSIEIIHDKNVEKFHHQIVKFHCDNARAVLKVLFKKVYGDDVLPRDTHQIKLSRSRPYKKEDNGHVEQKNGDKIRRLVGYHRYDTAQQVVLLNKLYDVEDLISNYFLPSQKLVKKIYNDNGRVVKKIYDKPQTPYHRLINSSKVAKNVKIKLKNIYKELNLVELRNDSERLKSELAKTVSRK